MNENIYAFSATETGYNHLKIDKVCEDASDFYADERMRICVVADGHGSDNYPRTDKGAGFAVNAAIKCTINFIENAEASDVWEDEKNGYRMMNDLAISILREWHQAVEKHYESNPFDEKELEKVSDKYQKKYLSIAEGERHIEKAYGCTLILFAVTDEYSFGLQIGDGKCVVIKADGDFVEPIPWDENCQMNVTTSICDSDAIEEFRFFVSKQMPVAVYCGSDGIDDSYANMEELYALYRSITRIFIEHDMETGKNEIKGYLPTLTKRGSGDDVSIGLIIDCDRAKTLSVVFDIQTEIFKAKEELSELCHQRDILVEKDNALVGKIRKWLDSGRKSPKCEENFNSLNNEIRPQKEQVDEKIADCQKKLSDLEVSLQEAQYEVSVASFGSISELETEVDQSEDAYVLNNKRETGSDIEDGESFGFDEDKATEEVGVVDPMPSDESNKIVIVEDCVAKSENMPDGETGVSQNHGENSEEM